MGKRVFKTADDFWSKFDRSDPDGCWIWGRPLTARGYTTFRFNGRDWRINRLAWFLSHPDWDETGFVCHRCDNPPCCNPKHLFVGSNLDNMADMVAKGRKRRGERHPMAVLTPKEVLEIRASPLRTVELTKIYSVSRGAVDAIRFGRKWKHI